MASIVFCDGREYGSAIPHNGNYSAAGVTVDTAAPRSGTYYMVAGGESDGRSRDSISTASNPTVIVGSVYISGGPGITADVVLFGAVTSTGDELAIGINTSGNLYAEFWSTGVGNWVGTQTGASLGTGYHRIDFRMDCSSTTHTIDWQVDGSAQTQASSTFGAAAQFYDFYWGAYAKSLFDSTGEAIDDLVLSYTSGDYPLGEYVVTGHVPNAVGTHNLDAATSEYFFYNSGGGDTAITTSETTSYQQIDQLPSTGSSDYLVLKPKSISGTDTNLLPKAQDVYAKTNYNESVSVLRQNIDEDTDSPDGNWGTATSTSADTYVRLGIANSTTTPATSGTLVVSAYMRKVGGTNTPDVRLDLFYNGSSIATGSTQNVTSATGQKITQNFDLATVNGAGELGDGTQLELAVVGIANTSGSPSKRSTVECGAVTYDSLPYSGSQQPTNTWYLEHGFTDNPSGTPAGVTLRNILAGVGSSSRTVYAKLYETTTLDMYTFTIASTSEVLAWGASATAPGGGAWTDAKFDALKQRWGYANTVSTGVKLTGVHIEQAQAAAAGRTIVSPCATALASVLAGTPLVSVTSALASALASVLAPTPAVTVSAPAATATATVVVPTIDKITNATVAAPVTTALGSFLPPLLLLDLPPPTASAAGALLPPVPAVAVSALVAATGSVLAPAPQVAVTAPAASAVGSLPGPTPQVTVVAPAATANGSLPAATVARSETIPAVPATAIGSLPAPVPLVDVSALFSATAVVQPPTPEVAIISPVLDAAATMPPPTPDSGVGRTVEPPPASATASVLAAVEVAVVCSAAAATATVNVPTPSVDETIVAPSATAAGSAPSPIPAVSVAALLDASAAVVPATPEIRVEALAAADGSLLPPVPNVTIVSPVAGAAAALPPPGVGGSKTVLTPAATAQGTLPAPTVEIRIVAPCAAAAASLPEPFPFVETGRTVYAVPMAASAAINVLDKVSVTIGPDAASAVASLPEPTPHLSPIVPLPVMTAVASINVADAVSLTIGVDAVAAVATLLAPEVIGDTNVVAPVATADASLPLPTLRVTVSAPAASAVASLPAPTRPASEDAYVYAALMVAQAVLSIPSVLSAATDALVSAPVMTAVAAITVNHKPLYIVSFPHRRPRYSRTRVW